MNALTQKSGFLFHISRERLSNLRECRPLHNIIFFPRQVLSGCERDHDEYSFKAEKPAECAAQAGSDQFNLTTASNKHVLMKSKINRILFVKIRKIRVSPVYGKTPYYRLCPLPIVTPAPGVI
jgi:hypothetical protein